MKNNRRLLFVLVVLAVAIGCLYLPAFRWLIDIWSNDRDYSHGFLIIPVCLYLAWVMRDRIPFIEIRPSFEIGGLLLLASGGLLIAGRSGGIALAEAVSFLLLVPGLILFSCGRDALKAFALPVAYLQFMVPWMDEFMNRIHGPFQLLSAHIGVWGMKAMGLVVYHDGKYISLPDITLEVARECSGVRYLTSILALGIPLVYLTQRTWLRSAAVIGAGMVITLLTNGFRVAIVGYMTHHYGVEMSHGPSHVFQGWFAAQIGFVALFLVNWAVGRIPSGSAVRLCERWKQAARQPSEDAKGPRAISRQAVFALLFLGGIGAYLHLFGTPRPLPARLPLGGFPLQVAEWSGRDTAWMQGDLFFPGADSEIVRTYRTADGREVHLYIAYFESQRQGKSLISFRSNPLREKIGEIPLTASAGPNIVNRSYPKIGQTRYETVFWYRFPDGETTGRLRTKAKGVTDAILNRRNSGAIVMVAAPLPQDEIKGEKTTEDLVAFIREASHALREYLP